MADYADVAGDQSGREVVFLIEGAAKAEVLHDVFWAVSSGDVSVADDPSGERAADALARCGGSG